MQTRKLKKYQQVVAECSELVAEGYGLCHLKEAQFPYDVKPLTGFVLGVLPGERFLAEIRRVKSKCFYGVLLPQVAAWPTEDSHNFADPKWALLSISPLRKPETCANFISCGGCKLLHLDYADTLHFKKKWFLSQLKGQHLEHPEVQLTASPKLYHYRNHVQVHINKYKERGFYSPMTYRTVAFPEDNGGCRLFDQRAFDESFPEELELVRCVRARLDEKSGAEVHSLYSEQDKKASFTYNVDFPKGSVTSVTIPNTAFFQVNLAILPIWLGKIESYIRSVKPEAVRLIDLFSGFGFISKLLSFRMSVLSIGIDILKPEEVRKVTINHSSRGSEKGGGENGRQEQAEKEHIFFDENYICGDLNTPPLHKLSEDNWKKLSDFNPELLLLNPPRSGFSPESIFILADKLPFFGEKKIPIIYSSCNGATMARDLKAFSELGYEIQDLDILDFFPWTAHYEILAFLT